MIRNGTFQQIKPGRRSTLCKKYDMQVTILPLANLPLFSLFTFLSWKGLPRQKKGYVFQFFLIG